MTRTRLAHRAELLEEVMMCAVPALLMNDALCLSCQIQRATGMRFVPASIFPAEASTYLLHVRYVVALSSQTKAVIKSVAKLQGQNSFKEAEAGKGS